MAAEYIPHRRHSELYDFKESFLHPKLIAYVNASPEERHNHIEELAHDIFRIPIFTDDFISKLNEEIDNAEKLRNDFNLIFDFNLWNLKDKVLESIRRDAGKWKPNPPNSMNKYGFRLREMGFFNFIDDFYNSKYIRFLLSNLLKVYFLSNDMACIYQFIGLAWQ